MSIVIRTLGFPSRELGFEIICIRFDVLVMLPVDGFLMDICEPELSSRDMLRALLNTFDVRLNKSALADDEVQNYMKSAGNHAKMILVHTHPLGTHPYKGDVRQHGMDTIAKMSKRMLVISKQHSSPL